MENPETQQINANLILHSLTLSVLIFLFLSVFAPVSMFILSPVANTCFRSWVPAGACPMLTVFGRACSVHITAHRCAEENKLHQHIHNRISEWLLFSGDIKKSQRESRDHERRSRAEERRLGWEEAMPLYRHINDKRKHSETWLQTEYVWRAHSSSSHPTHANKSNCHKTDIVAYRRWKFWKLCKIILHLSDTLHPYLTLLVDRPFPEGLCRGAVKCLPGHPPQARDTPISWNIQSEALISL